FGKFLPTINRKSSMIVIVHSVSSVAVASQHQLPSSWPNGQQPIETSQLKPNLHAHGTARLKPCPFKKHPALPLQSAPPPLPPPAQRPGRSEERRVGKEGRSRWA